MNLTVNKASFVSEILTPVSKIADNLAITFDLSEETTLIKTIVNSSDNSIILLASVPCIAKDSFKAIIPECKTFLRLFAGIDKENVSLSFDSNSISYKDNSFSFKYHLLDESYIVSKKSFSEEKLNSIKYQTTFELGKQKLSDIAKFNSIVPDAEKLYFFTQGNNVKAKLGDEQKANTNEIELEVSSSFSGAPILELLPINIHNILLFSFSSDKISVSINHELKIFKFETEHLKYVVSGLVK